MREEAANIIKRRIGEELCRFANGECDCQRRDRLCERVEVQADVILRLAASINSSGGDHV